MFVLSKLVDHLLLPPGIFFLLIVAAFVLLLYKKRLAHRVLLIGSAVLLYVFSIEPVKDALLLPLENRYEPLDMSRPVEADYICVLGAGKHESAPDRQDNSNVNRSGLKRLVYALSVYKRYDLPVIVTGGVAPKSATSEAEVMGRILISFGIDKDRILQEDESRNTWENASFVLKRYQPKRVILITSAFHMPRSVRTFERHNIEVVPAPTDYLTFRGPYTYRSFFPNMDALFGVQTALREYIGILYYRMRSVADRTTMDIELHDPAGE